MASKRDWKTCTDDKEKYQLYLASREWCKLREQVRERAGDRCERCDIFPMDACHHLSYANKYNESLEDLQAICTTCHEFTHGKSDFDPLENRDFIEWLACNPGDKPWLSHGFLASFLTEVFSFYKLLPVFQLFVTTGCIDAGAEQCIRTFGDCKDEQGIKLEDIGVVPSPVEFSILDMFDQDQKDFWHWLRWGGPSERPVGSREAFSKCVELAPRVNEERRHKGAKLKDF